MADPILTNTENQNIVWQIITGLLGFLGITLGTLWKRQESKVKELEARMGQLEKSTITRQEFNGAMEATRKELKDETKNVIVELHGCSNDVHASVDSIRRELTERFDRFITMWAKDK